MLAVAVRYLALRYLCCVCWSRSRVFTLSSARRGDLSFSSVQHVCALNVKLCWRHSFLCPSPLTLTSNVALSQPDWLLPPHWLSTSSICLHLHASNSSTTSTLSKYALASHDCRSCPIMLVCHYLLCLCLSILPSPSLSIPDNMLIPSHVVTVDWPSNPCIVQTDEV
ncbi:hypothetical protein BD414DRAFT_34611 [Trametes punicea]|nr:hypothetical protein BD414DRAFT_34611 [Trametes punicea]